MEQGKPFKETKIGKLLIDKVPEAAHMVGELLPDNGVLGVAKNIIEKSTLGPEEKEALNKQVNDLQVQMEKIEAEDYDSARNREVQLKNSIGIYVQNISAIMIILSFVAILFAVIFMKMEVPNKELVYTLLGSLGTMVVTIFNYWYGGSAGSTKKTDHLIDIINSKK